MKTVGVRINQTGEESELEQYISDKIKSGLVKTKTDAIKYGLYKAIEYENKYIKIQEELKKKDEQLELLYSVIERIKSQPIYIERNNNNNNNSQAFKSEDNFNLDIDLTDDTDLITITKEQTSDEDLEEEFLRKFG